MTRFTSTVTFSSVSPAPPNITAESPFTSSQNAEVCSSPNTVRDVLDFSLSILVSFRLCSASIAIFFLLNDLILLSRLFSLCFIIPSSSTKRSPPAVLFEPIERSFSTTTFVPSSTRFFHPPCEFPTTV